MDYLRLILFPLSLVYLIIILLRFVFYRLNIFKSYNISAYVISVGNLNTGGSGKTPFCIFMTDLFLSLNKTVCIISRGYRRESKGLLVAFDGVSEESPENTGDELMMMVNRFRHYKNRFFAIADNNRVRAANYAVNEFKPDVIILDDAFQHLSIKRDADFLLNDCTSVSFTDNILLPAGNLREPQFLSYRADIRVNNFKFSNRNIEYEKSKSINAKYISKGFYNKTNTLITDLKNKNAVVFSGLAKNESFFIYAEGSTGVRIKNKISFPDHHDYDLKDINKLISLNEENEVFLTTEKDFIKLNKFTDFLDNFEVYYLKIDLITDKNRIFELLNSIKKIC